MKKFIIYGAGDFADIMKYYVENDLKQKVVSYTVHSAYMEDDEKSEISVVPFETLEEFYRPEEYSIILGIIGRDMFRPRAKIYYEIKAKGYDMPNIIHSKSSIAPDIIGDANIIMDNSVIGPKCKIGNGNIIWPCVSIAHQNIVGDFNQFAGCSSSVGQIEIGNNCFIGNNCTINAKIADFTFVGAGTYIRKNTEEYGVYTTSREIKIDKKSYEVF
jgi:acetyltransferase-like isoleucine patch superfamily enzyme